MEDALALLRDQDGVLKEWSDRQILPGQEISRRIQEQLKNADILVFLISSNFISSVECRKEWARSGELLKERPSVVRVPIILGDCDWKNLDGMAEHKALPDDAKPIKTFSDRDTAWQQVCEGLRALIDGLRENFTIKAEFRHEMEQTEFISSDHVLLPQIFVFPRLTSYRATKAQDRVEKTITSAEQLFRSKHLLIHGDELSGKTALCRHLFLTLVDDAKPVLYVDLTTVNGRASAAVFRDAYDQEFNGDYSLWKSKTDKTIVLDNLSQASHAHEHVLLAVEHFERVIVTVSSHTFYAYFRDDDRLAQFRVIQILPLTHSAQERLIRQRLSLSDNCSAEALDGRIDQVENQVNAIVLSNKIVPRYPFYVLSILQTHEAFMPGNLSITSHGHCYHVLILSYLIKAGISRADDEIDSCLNFAEQLAYEMHCIGTERDGIGADAFEEFVKKYKNTYLLKESTLSRLCDRDYGILSRSSGRFKIPYMYYFFLGRYLAKYADKHKSVIDRMLERSYVKSNCLTLIFIIHHTSDNAIIEDIVLRNMCTLDEIKPAILDKNEARIFEDIVSAIPADILSKDSVGSERQRERIERERQESQDEGLDAETSIAVVNDIYRILKNNEILGQVLKNKYGSLERKTIVEIIEAIADGGLRLVRLLVGSQEEMNDFAAFLHRRRPELELEKIKNALRVLSFIWTMSNVEMIVGALNKPEIRNLVEEVVAKRGTPAYDVIGYFLRLDTAQELTGSDHEMLRSMLAKYRYPFLERVLSLRTQRYLNTHKVQVRLEQAMCADLKIKYRAKLKAT